MVYCVDMTTDRKGENMNVAYYDSEQGRVAIDMDGARQTAWDYLYGKQSHRLSQQDWIEVYCQADGFGDCCEGAVRAALIEYIGGGTDWSHVRDSSPEAMGRVLATIIERQAS